MLPSTVASRIIVRYESTMVSKHFAVRTGYADTRLVPVGYLFDLLKSVAIGLYRLLGAVPFSFKWVLGRLGEQYKHNSVCANSLTKYKKKEPSATSLFRQGVRQLSHIFNTHKPCPLGLHTAKSVQIIYNVSHQHNRRVFTEHRCLRIACAVCQGRACSCL